MVKLLEAVFGLSFVRCYHGAGIVRENSNRLAAEQSGYAQSRNAAFETGAMHFEALKACKTRKRMAEARKQGKYHERDTDVMSRIT